MKKSPLFIVFFTIFIDLLGFGIIIPLLPFYAGKFQATESQIGLLFAIYSFTQLIFSPIWGRLSDKLGRRPIIMFSVLGSFLANLWTGYGDSLWILFAARGLAGAMAANVSTTQAYIADVTTPENRAKGMGLVGAAFGLGFIFGPAMGGLISHYMNVKSAFFFAAGLSFIDLILAYFLLPESLKISDKPEKGFRHFDITTIRHAFQNRQLMILMLLYFFVIFSFSSLEGTLALFVKDKFKFDAHQTGYLFAFMGVVSVIVQGGLVGRFVKKHGERVLIVGGAFLLIFGVGMVPLPATITGLVLVGAVSTLAIGFSNPSILSLISQISNPTEQGGMMGLTQSLSSLGRILGPAWGGLAYQYWGKESPYFSCAAIMLFAFLLSLPLLRYRGIDKDS